MPNHIRGMAKRGYSREFTPKTERRVQLLIDRIPPTLYDAVKAKAKREGVSLRALVLNFLSEWVGRPTRRTGSDGDTQNDPARERIVFVLLRAGTARDPSVY